MQSRRNFIGKVASGLAGVREAMACPNTDFVAFADHLGESTLHAKSIFPPD